MRKWDSLHGDFDAVVVDNVGHADELHIVLECHRVGDALADHSVAIHGYASLLDCHRLPPPWSRCHSSITPRRLHRMRRETKAALDLRPMLRLSVGRSGAVASASAG
jgi:hypothetical protein